MSKKRIWVSDHGQAPVPGPGLLIQVFHRYGHESRVRQLFLPVVIRFHAIVIVVPVVLRVLAVLLLLLLVGLDIHAAGITAGHHGKVRVRAAPGQQAVVATGPSVTAFFHATDRGMPHRTNEFATEQRNLRTKRST